MAKEGNDQMGGDLFLDQARAAAEFDKRNPDAGLGSLAGVFGIGYGMSSAQRKPKLHIFHQWERWHDGFTKDGALVQTRHCIVCNKVQLHIP